jgi:ribonuclease E
VIAEPHAIMESQPIMEAQASALSITEPVQPAVSENMPTMESSAEAEILTPTTFEPTQRTETAPVTAYAPPAEAAAAAERVEERAGVVETQSVLAALKLDWSGDLVQIETDPQKLRPIPVEEEAPRPRRVRRPPPPMSDEPLVQVETRRRETGAESLHQV